jgi:N-acetylmuramoyl-L-alanine amidase
MEYISTINNNKLSEDRPQDFHIDNIVLTYSRFDTIEETTNYMLKQGTSVHYTIKQDGFLDQHHSESQKTYYAGVSAWRDQASLNGNSIGIMLINDAKSPFSEIQIAKTVDLIQDINARYEKTMEVVGLGEVNKKHIAPGIFFPWDKLAENNIGKMVNIPENLTRDCTISLGDSGEHVRVLQEKLKTHGYGVEVSGTFDELTGHFVQNFANRYAPLPIEQQDATSNFLDKHFACWNEVNDFALNDLLGLNNTSVTDEL